MTELKIKIPKLEFAVILSTISAISYYITYTYETKYCAAFGIPADFVSIDLRNILPVVTVTIVGMMAIIFFGFLAVYSHKNLKNLFLRPFISSMLMAFSLILAMVFAYHGFKYLMHVNIALLTAALLYTVFRMIWPLKHTVPNNEDTSSMDPHEAISAFRSLTIAAAIFLTIATLSFAGNMATSDANEKEDFYVLSNDPTMIVIRAYGDNSICVCVGKNGKLTGDIKVVETTSIEKLKKTHLGRLTTIGDVY